MEPEDKAKFLDDLQACLNDEIKSSPTPNTPFPIPCETIYFKMTNYLGNPIPDRVIIENTCDCPCLINIHKYLIPSNRTRKFSRKKQTTSTSVLMECVALVRCLKQKYVIHLLELKGVCMEESKQNILKHCSLREHLAVQFYKSKTDAKLSVSNHIIVFYKKFKNT